MEMGMGLKLRFGRYISSSQSVSWYDAPVWVYYSNRVDYYYFFILMKMS
jgi:hypothetical protein